MTRYKAEDGTILDTEKAVQSWEEATRWNGNNHISIPTGSQWDHEKLHLSSKGRYWIESWSQWQGSTPSARLVSESEAAAWLLANDHEDSAPESLKAFMEQVSE